MTSVSSRTKTKKLTSLLNQRQKYVFNKNLLLPQRVKSEVLLRLFSDTAVWNWTDELIIRHYNFSTQLKQQWLFNLSWASFTHFNTLRTYSFLLHELWLYENYGRKPLGLVAKLGGVSEFVGDVERLEDQGFEPFKFNQFRRALLLSDWQLIKKGLRTPFKNLALFIFHYKLEFRLTLSRFYKETQVDISAKYLPYYYLIWTFARKHRVYLNMRSKANPFYNYFSLSPGIFLKFYGGRRPLKRSKLFRFLLVKFLRKILLHSGIQHLFFIVNHGPVLFQEMYKLLFTPDINPYSVPYKSSLYRDDIINAQNTLFNVHGFVFQRTKFYGIHKLKNKGRLKRRVTRRLIAQNKVLD